MVSIARASTDHVEAGSVNGREDDGVRWLALLLLQVATLLVKEIKRRYGIGHGVKCPHCGHGF